MALVVVVVLPGCLGNQDERVGYQEGNVSAFRAAYQLSSGEEIHLRLETVRQVMDRDGKLLHLYELQMETSGQPAITLYLDSSLRLLRWDLMQNCADHGGACEYHAVFWNERGYAAPVGLGYPQLLGGRGNLELFLWNEEWPVQASVSRDASDVLELTILGDDTAGDRLLQAALPGRYSYADDHLLPHRIDRQGVDGDAGSGAWETALLIEWVELDRLPRADTIFDWTQQISPGPRDATLFPGTDRGFLDSGATIDEAFEWLLQESARAAALMDAGGCLARVRHFRTPANDSEVPSLDGLGDDGFTSFHFLLQGATTAGHLWEVEHSSSAGASDGEFRIVDESEVSRSETCATAGRSPRPSMSVPDFVRFTEGIVLHRSDILRGLHLESVPASAPPYRPEVGWGQYGATFVPPGFGDAGGVSTAFNYRVSMSPHFGWVQALDLHPDDVARLDGDGFSWPNHPPAEGL